MESVDVHELWGSLRARGGASGGDSALGWQGEKWGKRGHRVHTGARYELDSSRKPVALLLGQPGTQGASFPHLRTTPPTRPRLVRTYDLIPFRTKVIYPVPLFMIQKENEQILLRPHSFNCAASHTPRHKKSNQISISVKEMPIRMF